MERLKEEARWKTEQAAQLKEFEAASALKRIEVKKKLQEVRKVSAHRHSKVQPYLTLIVYHTFYSATCTELTSAFDQQPRPAAGHHYAMCG